MIRFRINMKVIITIIILSSTIVLMVFSGCKRQKGDKQKFIFELAVSTLTEVVEKREMSDIGKRSKVALSKLKNGILDTEPMMLEASIDLVEPKDEPVLILTYFDEDKDLRGLRIKEQYVDPNGTIRTLEEDYPLFVNALDGLICESVHFSVRVRDKNQRKDKILWLEYVNKNLDGLIRKYIDKKQQDDPNSFVRKVPWKEEEMPPVYVSVPDPNRVRVFISIYDRAGNESESVELLALPYIRAKYLSQNNLNR